MLVQRHIPANLAAVLAAVLTCGCLATTASAQDLGTVKEMMTSDGVITKAQAEAVLNARFEAIDANHDGKISKDEYVNAAMARLFALDTDHDGKITRTELRASMMERFRR